ncbi:SDR family NAD(P)-dependent oxidoreductase, partial [Actinomycetospora sp. OC33-EN08]
AVNGPAACVISGDELKVAEVAARFERTKKLSVSHAFHSARMAPMLDEFRQVVQQLTFHEPRIPVVSNGSTEHIGDPEHWVSHVRDTVRFADTLQIMEAGVVLELGPDGTLSSLAEHGIPARPDVMKALGQLHLAGVEIDWQAVLPDARPTELPTYPWQHRRFWLEPAPVGGAAADPDEERFWDAVEREDLDDLAETMQLNGERREVAPALPVISAWRRERRRRAALDDLRMHETWEPRPAQPDRGDPPSGTVLVIVPPGVEAEVGTAMEVAPGTTRADLAARLAGTEADLVLSLLGELGGREAVLATAVLVQALGDAAVRAPLWCLTRGTADPAFGDDPGQTALAGLGRSVALEHPDRWGGLVDVPVGEVPWAEVLAAISADDDEDQLAVTPTGTRVRRIVPAGPVDADAWTPRGTVLVTGGTGALGRHVARWAADRGAEHLVLASRSGAEADGVDDLVADLEARGAAATVTSCDLTDRDAVAALLPSLPGDLTAVVHAAGAPQLARLEETTAEEFTQVLAAKVDGAEHLDALLHDTPLDAFVLFSSIAATWGSGGQAAYAAANAWLDGLARARRGRGLAATAVAWGAWSGGGMAGSDEGADHLRRQGLDLMDPEVAVGALGGLPDEGPVVAVAAVRWSRFLPAFTTARPAPLFAAFAEPEVVEEDGAGDDRAATWTAGLLELAPDDRAREALEVVRREASSVAGLSGPRAVDPDVGFFAAGFDSLTVVELRDRLRAVTGVTLATTVVFDHPTPTELAAHLLDEVLATVPPPAPEPAPGGPLAELDRLERSLDDAAEITAEERAAVVDRLEDLLGRWRTPTGDDGGDALADASAEDMFSLIEQEFGKS